MSFKIITDTSANLPTAMVRENGVTVIPFSYFIKDKEYSCLDTEGFDGKTFYRAMRMGAQIRTSQINPTAYIKAMEPILSAGEDILFIGMSSGISGSYRSAEMAKAELVEKYPDREIYLVDTKGASLGEGLHVINALEYQRRGMTLQKIYERLIDDVKHTYQVFTVDDLTYLRNTGRVKGSAAMVGNMLQIKPILKGNEDGEIVSFQKVMGRKKAIDTLAMRYNMLVENPEKQTVCIAHADCQKDADALIALLNEKKPPKEIITVMYEPVTGSHVGPGTLALFFMGSESVRYR